MEQLKREYFNDWKPSKEYLDNMPDIQNDGFEGQPIERVGISGFKLPLQLRQKNGNPIEVLATVDGMVSLDAESRGINMSRILRTFYKFKDEPFSIDKLGEILKSYCTEVGSFESQINVNFQYRMWQESLVSTKGIGQKNGGWQYYNVTLSGNLAEGIFRKTIVLDFIYSSTCPCSTELSLYNADVLGVYCTPHSQRSVMRMYIDVADEMVWIEDLILLCRNTLKTETQVFVKREDEGAFAWLNGSNTKFVEDAIRMVGYELGSMNNIVDFKLICSHNESLHNHNAIAVYIPYKSRFSYNVSTVEWNSLNV